MFKTRTMKKAVVVEALHDFNFYKGDVYIWVGLMLPLLTVVEIRQSIR